MSITPDIARKLFEGIRFNLKDVVLPQLKDYPYPSSQAVASYVLLKTLAGYISPEYEKGIRDSIEEMRGILEEAKALFCDSLPAQQAAAKELCGAIKGQLQKQNALMDPYTQYQRLMRVIDMLMKSVWEDIEVDEKMRERLKHKLNQCLRRQLDKELALFT